MVAADYNLLTCVKRTVVLSALKWLSALHDILLRLPPRGGRRGRNILEKRFQAWSDGDFASLVMWWMTDRTAAHRRLRSETAEEDQTHRAALRALRLLSSGDISRALKGLCNQGLGDMSDERVLLQLAEKHPERKEVLPDTLDDFEPFARLHVDLGETLCRLDPRAGTGTSGFRNSFLRLLARDFADAKAASAVGFLNDFANRYITFKWLDGLSFFF